MKILHAITSLRKSAGTTTFVNGLAGAEAALGDDVSIAVISLSDDCLGEPPPAGVRVLEMAGVPASGERFDFVHLHGLWEPPVNRICAWARKSGIPVAWSPHGALSPWAMRHKRLKKLAAWHIFQKRNLASAALLHATSAMEAKWISDFKFSGKIVLAPLGTSAAAGAAMPGVRRAGEGGTVLFVGRVYPVKGLVNLVEAWALFKARNPSAAMGWKISIVGPDQAGHMAELKKLASALSLDDCVEFKGPEYGDALAAEYENCDFLVLPSHTENFGGVVLDALAHGKPCIASTFTPWEVLEKRGCGIWISNAPGPLSLAVEKMVCAGAAERSEMGARGRRLVEEEYSWRAVAEKIRNAMLSLRSAEGR